MAAPLEFVVPLYTEDLEVVKSDRYCVHTVLDVEGCDDVDAIIDEVADVILNCDDLLTCILRHDVYDKLYSLVKCVAAGARGEAVNAARLAVAVGTRRPPTNAPGRSHTRAGTGRCSLHTSSSGWWRCFRAR